MEDKICPFIQKFCMKENCVFYDREIAKCEFKGKADYIVDCLVDYLIEVRDAITKLQGGDDD